MKWLQEAASYTALRVRFHTSLVKMVNEDVSVVPISNPYGNQPHRGCGQGPIYLLVVYDYMHNV